MEPVRILQALVEYMNEHLIDGQSLVSFDEVEGTEGDAEVRVGYGGRDLFDLRIERV
jgi:hypothetical protein